MHLRKQIEALEKQIGQICSDTYSTHRDEDGYLFVTFDNQESIRIPALTMRPYQIRDQKALFLEGKKRIAAQYPRRSGKEVESWSFLVSAAVETPGMYLMGYPTNVRAKKVLWQGQITLPDKTSLRFLEMIPKKLVSKIDNSDMTITLTNGSIIWVVGSDIDPDKMRGINPMGAVLSEFAFCNPNFLYTLLPIFRQNGGWVFCQSTYNGMNHFYRMIRDNKDKNEWHCISESIVTLVDENGNRYVTDEMIEEDRLAGMPEYLIQQEYYGNVQINQETRYFAREINYLDTNEKIVSKLILYDTPCYTAWDLGMNDKTAVIIFQMDYDGNPVLIDYFEDNNKELDFYMYECRARVIRHGLHIRTHFGPHDSDSVKFPHTKTTIDYARDMGEMMIATTKPHSKIAAIQQMRKMIYRCRFNKEGTVRLIDCLSNYEKEYNEKLQVYKDHPLHNWASDGVDAFQSMTIAIDDGLVGDRGRGVIYNIH